MVEQVKIAIIGAGPAGLSAAARCQALQIPYRLIDRAPHLADTIYKYQKQKYVMAEPSFLPLRSDIPFEAGSREQVLKNWGDSFQQQSVPKPTFLDVSKISFQAPNFHLFEKDRHILSAEFVILALGVQGDLRKLGVEGEDLPFVHYQLDDAKAIKGETIIVVGAGDSALENALALSESNEVFIINRRDEFARAKEKNNDAILKAIENKQIQCFYKSAPGSVTITAKTKPKIEKTAPASPIKEAPGDLLATNIMQTNITATNPTSTNSTNTNNRVSAKKGVMRLKTEDGEVSINCDRVIARLGGIPPRKFVEDIGVEFFTKQANSLARLSPHFESNVPGLFIVGALAGYPLIKQCMNQGYEVVEKINGNPLVPVDEPLLAEKLLAIYGNISVTEKLTQLKEAISWLKHLSDLQIREWLFESEIITVSADQTIYPQDEYTDSLYSVIEGSITLCGTSLYGEIKESIKKGGFFGEVSLISGRRREHAAQANNDGVLIKTPRRQFKKLLNSIEPLNEQIQRAFTIRLIRQAFNPQVSIKNLRSLCKESKNIHLKAGQHIYQEQDKADQIYIIRAGSIAISRHIGDRNITTSYLAAGSYFGELCALDLNLRTETAKANVATDLVAIPAQAFKQYLKEDLALNIRLKLEAKKRLTANVRMEMRPESGELVSFLVDQGIGEATDILLIDESLCVGCDQCEKACAATHQGTSRLDRKAGATFAQIHVPTSCRHCEDPHCMTDCPPDAIHRSSGGEVYIDDSCIGCGNCVAYCPYGVVKLAAPGAHKPNLLSSLLFGIGNKSKTASNGTSNGTSNNSLNNTSNKNAQPAQKKAVKCDMCKDNSGGAACVRACPTGAAVRLSPEQLPKYIGVVQDKS